MSDLLTLAKKIRIAVLISGEGTNLQSIIDRVKAGKLDAEVAVVISNKKEAHGLVRARRSGVPAFFVDPKAIKDRQKFDERVLEILTNHHVELVVMAGYMRLVQPLLISAFARRIINLHPSLLPKFKGANAPQQALDAKVEETGSTVHHVVAELDAGEPVLQVTVPVLEGDDADTLLKRIQKEEHKMLPKAIQMFADDKVN
ncbi:MAG: phosphoribosylglycinamide formyltransferase [Candidatus Micrarchaeia archaeon]